MSGEREIDYDYPPLSRYMKLDKHLQLRCIKSFRLLVDFTALSSFELILEIFQQLGFSKFLGRMDNDLDEEGFFGELTDEHGNWQYNLKFQIVANKRICIIVTTLEGGHKAIHVPYHVISNTYGKASYLLPNPFRGFRVLPTNSGVHRLFTSNRTRTIQQNQTTMQEKKSNHTQYDEGKINKYRQRKYIIMVHVYQMNNIIN